MQVGDTIAAISSPTAPSARIIVRLSGPRSREIIRHLLVDIQDEWNPGTAYASRLQLRNSCASQSIKIPAQIYDFRAPHSYTGQEIVELHIPGNPLLARMLLEELIANGARAAEAGEFTARAYFAGKIDLTQAEGVAAAIHAQGESELNASRQLLAGELTRRLKPLSDLMAETLALVEAGIDFAEEGISFLPVDDLRERIGRIDSALEAIVRESARFERMSHEPSVVLAGRPNAGKSTLLNALAGQTRAVVSAMAGTTRDAIWAEVALPRGVIRVTDVAGISEPADYRGGTHPDIADFLAIEGQMQEQASKAIAIADIVVLVVDATDDRAMLSLTRSRDMIVRTKQDLFGAGGLTPSPRTPGEGEDFSLPDQVRIPIVFVSAHTGEGIEELKRALDRLCFGESAAGAVLSLNARHLQAISEARTALLRARVSIEVGMELLAAELREVLDAVGRITGQITPDDLLGRIFSSFCIGK